MTIWYFKPSVTELDTSCEYNGHELCRIIIQIHAQLRIPQTVHSQVVKSWKSLIHDLAI
jgi:hypothetical protein